MVVPSATQVLDLLDHASSSFSQAGEDGILAMLFSVVGTEGRLCCEFGAGDGIHLSNTRAMLLAGWHGVLIEADAERFRALARTYAAAPGVTCIHAAVDTDDNSLASLFQRAGIASEGLDFVSIDIDGPDFEVFQALGVRPRVICVEVSAGHPPDESRLLPPQIARTGVGQPLPCFCDAAERLGYRLVGYNGLNAFFLRSDLGYKAVLPTLSPVEAYGRFLSRQTPEGRRYLHYLNAGHIFPFYRFRNPYLTPVALGLPRLRTVFGGAKVVVRRRASQWLRGTPLDTAVRGALARLGIRLARYDECGLS